MPSKYLLDTNILSFLLDDRDNTLLERISRLDESQLFISSITWYELWFGLEVQLNKTPANKRLLAIRMRLQQWCEGLQIVSFDASSAIAAANLNASLAKKGRVLQQPDLFIAAQAIANGFVLISHDHRAFNGLKAEGLLWEDWCSL